MQFCMLVLNAVCIDCIHSSQRYEENNAFITLTDNCGDINTPYFIVCGESCLEAVFLFLSVFLSLSSCAAIVIQDRLGPIEVPLSDPDHRNEFSLCKLSGDNSLQNGNKPLVETSDKQRTLSQFVRTRASVCVFAQVGLHASANMCVYVSV